VDGERGYGHAKQHDAGAVARGEGERHPLALSPISATAIRPRDCQNSIKWPP
jgi:hypothetical protein